MPPIPVHIDDPIVPEKAPGPTAAAPQHPTEPHTTPDASSAYVSARPGAAAVPAPTAYVPRPPPEPTRTQDLPPPPPQPGAVPIPPSYQQAATPTASPLPPPPKPGEALKQRQTGMPSQMQIPPPAQNYAPSHATIPNAPAHMGQPGSGPTTLNFGPVAPTASAAHPPAYHQNTYAQDLTPAQRTSLDAQERKESVMGNLGGDSAGETAGNMWNAVKSWANSAGEKLAETEESVWKRINGQ